MAPVTKKSKETEPSKAIKIPKKKVVGKDNPTIARSPQTSMTDFFGKVSNIYQLTWNSPVPFIMR
ncbi:unnamed protein product [Anisakis simplex]|uniref:30S ribosomal protein S11 n=1 Tax=Anisakis simplex TaxID=6269 RepID=A0A0M3JLV0_ANISI|nr:unnamed protein product [Anisakis simplex]